MLAKNANDNAGFLNKRGVCGFFASKLAPTKVLGNPFLERLAQVQVHRLLIIIIEPIAEIQRPQGCIKPQENTRGVDIAAVELLSLFHARPRSSDAPRYNGKSSGR